MTSMAQEERSELLVWDSEGTPPSGTSVVEWSSIRGESSRSVPMFLEENADAVRSRFLAWVHDLGETVIAGKRVIDHLAIRPGFSLWWMSLLAEKNYGKSPYLVDAIKMIAFEMLMRPMVPTHLTLASGNRALAAVFRLYCGNMGIGFRWLDRTGGAANSLGRRVHRALPQPVQALCHLVRYLVERWPLRRVGTGSFACSPARTTFFSYLFNLDRSAFDEGRFTTFYWTGLHRVIEQGPAAVNWVQIFYRHGSVPTARRAVELIKSFDGTGGNRQFHGALDGALSFRVMLRALADYGRVVAASWRLRSIVAAFRLRNSAIDLWPFFQDEWDRSLAGVVGMRNCLTYNIIEETVRRLPHQELGVYLLENQGWEMALVHAWRAAGHGRLVGVPHSTVRYWDLRYFFDRRSYERTTGCDLPLADQWAVNGPAARTSCLEGGFPADCLGDVEALRYLYLCHMPPRTPRQSGPLRVLVLGDYLASVTRGQLQLLYDSLPLLPVPVRFTIKPHPNCPVKLEEYPELKAEVTTAPLATLLAKCDAAYTSNITSAAVDAFCAGVPVISVLDGATLNLSPLREQSGVEYVALPEELARAVGSIHGSVPRGGRHFFTLDEDLPRWRRLLGSGESPSVTGMLQG